MLNFKYRKWPVKVLRHFCVSIIFDVLVFWLQGPLKKKLSLEPLSKLATFIDAIINYQNILKKFWKIVCRRRIRRRQKRCSKTAKFFLTLLFHIQNFNQSWAHRSYKLSERSKAMSDLWFSEWKKMSVERWANCQEKEFAHRSKRSLSLKERAFWEVRSLSDVTMLSYVSPYVLSKYYAHSVGAPTVYPCTVLRLAIQYTVGHFLT